MKRNAESLWQAIRSSGTNSEFGSEFWSKHWPTFEAHKLSGWVYSLHQHQMPKEDQVRYRGTWKFQLAKNILLQKELEKFADLAASHGTTVCVLKGASLVRRVYVQDPGVRFMSDLDLLVDPAQMEFFAEAILQSGYEEVKSLKWEANQFKRNFTKMDAGIELVIELHSKLLWNEAAGFDWQRVAGEKMGLEYLSREDELAYLTTHLAYQHNFGHLGWLIDIDQLIRTQATQSQTPLRWERVLQVATALQARRACIATLMKCAEFFNTPVPASVLQHKPQTLEYFITETFLWNPRSNLVQYYLLKHLLKDTLWHSLKYDLLWVKNRLSSRLRSH